MKKSIKIYESNIKICIAYSKSNKAETHQSSNSGFNSKGFVFVIAIEDGASMLESCLLYPRHCWKVSSLEFSIYRR